MARESPMPGSDGENRIRPVASRRDPFSPPAVSAAVTCPVHTRRPSCTLGPIWGNCPAGNLAYTSRALLTWRRPPLQLLHVSMSNVPARRSLSPSPSDQHLVSPPPLLLVVWDHGSSFTAPRPTPWTGRVRVQRASRGPRHQCRALHTLRLGPLRLYK